MKIGFKFRGHHTSQFFKIEFAITFEGIWSILSILCNSLHGRNWRKNSQYILVRRVPAYGGTILMISSWCGNMEKIAYKIFLSFCHDSIKFTAKYSAQTVEILDVQVILEGGGRGKLATDLFVKETDTHQYLEAFSCYPYHCMKAIPSNAAICRLLTMVFYILDNFMNFLLQIHLCCLKILPGLNLHGLYGFLRTIVFNLQ